MYLPQDDKDWTMLGRDGRAVAVQEMNDHLKVTRGIETPLTLDRIGGTLRSIINSSSNKKPMRRGSHSGLLVEWVETRPLPFYGEGWLLHRFSCVIDSIPGLEGYERIAHLFSVRAPRATIENQSSTFANVKDSGEWTLIDWTSSPLHKLNKKARLNLSNLEQEHVRAYLVFFCSFIGGKEDVDYARTPFLIPKGIKDFLLQDALPPLAEVARKNLLRTFRPQTGIDNYDTFDFYPDASNTETTTKEVTQQSPEIDDTSLKSFCDALKEAFAAVNGINPPVASNRASKDDGSEHEAPDTSVILYVEGALVWYRHTLFRTTFSVKCNGEVSMDDDVQVTESDTQPRLDIRQARPPVPLLCRESKRDEISNEELLDRIRRSLDEDSETKGQQLRLRGLRVSNDVIDSGIFDGAVRLENVEFVGNVLFDDAVFERSLELIDCRFLQRLSARNTTVKGAFRLDRSHCLGALDPQDTHDTLSSRPEATLDLRGLEAQGGFFGDHLTVFGRIRAQWARIGGAMRARGLQVHPRLSQANDNNRESVNFSHVVIDGPLDLVGHTLRSGAVLDKARRTFICGDAELYGLCTQQADLRGILVRGHLNLSSSEISGSANLGVLKFDDRSENSWRSRIDKTLDLCRVQAGLVIINGCKVGWDLMMVELRLNRSLFANLDRCFRTKVEGAVNLSGARIQGDIDFSGAEISGRFTFITGRCGRLRLSAKPWLHPSNNTPGISETLAQSVLLMDLQVDAGIDVAGLHTLCAEDNDNKVKGDFVALGTRLGGGLRFWREDAITSFKLNFTVLGQAHDPKAIEEAINGIRAHISGKLDLRGIRTAGSINLGRCKVDGKIRLENARIGGNLSAHFDNTNTCEVEAFIANLARIEGDADLRGLNIRGDLSACDSRVGGKVLLPTGRDGTHAYVRGSIHLTGMHAAARLVVNGRGLLEEAKTSTNARIDLSLCQIGQLSVFGFTKNPGKADRFGHRINLLAIQVGDWYFDENEQVRALLAETEPFDAGNYIDIEQRLARIGNRGLANRIYRDMKKRAYLDINTQQGKSQKSWFWLKKLGFWLKKLGLWMKFRFDWCFSGHGTLPFLMAIWLLLSMVPVTYLLSDYRNVEFALIKKADNKGTTGTPVSNGQDYVLKSDWGPGKAFGLAISYAIPFYGGARPETVRARLNGPICAPHNDEQPACKAVLAEVSPHGFAMFVSVIQFALWIFIAANLPTIVRRRS